jgi:hypothetical protein
MNAHRQMYLSDSSNDPVDLPLSGPDALDSNQTDGLAFSAIFEVLVRL